LRNKSLYRVVILRKRAEMEEAEVKRVLVVDDDTGVLRIIREALQNFLHWEVDTSPKPEYAFELALKKNYDLMIFDFAMPLIDGTLLFLLISKVYENASPARMMPPLLLVSGQGGDERAQELLREARVCGFLPKPFTINRLLQKVKECFPEMQAVVSGAGNRSP
jgi:DNA-binding response OmpR family regulator